MPTLFTTEALILKTYDVGETARLCTLLTQEYGKLTAYAPGARRVKSTLGGGLLVFSRASLELKERNSTFLITAARSLPLIPLLSSPPSFAIATQGVELLLNLVEEREPLPEVFTLTVEFLAATLPLPPPALLPAFSLKLLHLLGLLPLPSTLGIDRPHVSVRPFLNACAQETSLSTLLTHAPCIPELKNLCTRYLMSHLPYPLRAPTVAKALLPIPSPLSVVPAPTAPLPLRTPVHAHR